MLDKANKMLDFNLLDLCLKGPETELERLGGSKRWAKIFPRGLAWRHNHEKNQPRHLSHICTYIQTFKQLYVYINHI